MGKYRLRMTRETRRVLRLSKTRKSGNYANCDGTYVEYLPAKLNGRAVFVNHQKHRFIAWTGHRWVLTSSHWLRAILKKGGNFGGFHGGDASYRVPLAMGKYHLKWSVSC